MNHSLRVWLRVLLTSLCALALWADVAITAQTHDCQSCQAFAAVRTAPPPPDAVSEAAPLLCMTPPPDALRKGAVAVFATKPPHIVTDVGLGTRYDRFCWSADHKDLLACKEDGTLVLLHYDAAKCRFGPPQSVASAYADAGVRYTLNAYNSPFAWSRDRRYIVIMEDTNLLELYDVKTGKHHKLVDMTRRTTEISDVAFAPDGTRLVFSAAGHDISDNYSLDTHNDLWIVDISGDNLHKLGHGDCPNWSPDGKWLLAVVGSGREIRRYDVQTGHSRVLRHTKLEVWRNAVYSPDGRTIAMVGQPHFEQGDLKSALFLTDSEGKFLRILADRNQADITGEIWLAW